MVTYFGKQIRIPVLLVASYFFYYTQEPDCVLLLFGITTCSYVSVLLFENKICNKFKVLSLSVLIHLGMLGFYKYYGFGTENLKLIGLELPHLDVVLPIGISFYVFQSLSYLFDVYYKAIPAEKNFFRYALFIAFFPQLVAGPIMKARNFIPQINNPDFRINREDIYVGIKSITIGLFLKLVIADNLAFYTHSINYPMFMNRHSLNLLFLSYGYGAQILCDFAGYSFLAIGSSRLLGFKLMMNFSYPFLATGINDFWKRWHISLTNWFKDYVFLRVVMSRAFRGKIYVGMMLTFLLSGLWHGASWSFVIWGGLHGLLCVIEHKLFSMLKIKSPKGILKVILWFMTLNFVCFAFVLFALSEWEHVPDYFNAMLFSNWEKPLLLPRIGDLSFYISLVALYHVFHALKEMFPKSFLNHRVTEVLLLSFLMVMTINLWGESRDFIYFRF